MSDRILYLECFSGISGDMTVASLLDLGADPEILKKALASLAVPGYEISIGRRQKCGIDACSFDVILASEETAHKHGHSHEHGDSPQHHDHSHEHGHSHEHNHEHGHTHEHSHEHNHEHGHAHEHNHEHNHEHGHTHGHENHHSHNHADSHDHRNIGNIYEIIDRLDSNDRVKTLAKKMFDIVAEAESKAHGIPVSEVHFHEVGAVDSIVDIISVAVLIDNLGITEVVVSPLYEGQGHVWCQHGVIPVPVPAVVNIAASHKLALKLTDNNGEMVTPTGAAIAAALKTREALPAAYKILKVGLGAGKKDFKKANLLRAMLITADTAASTAGEDEVWVLESNIDDCSGEALGYTMEKLLAAGGKDVYHLPIFMKKNRPGYILGTICDERDISALEDIILTHTTTVGIRKYPVKRRILKREIRTLHTPWGEALVKLCQHQNETYYYPEYESVKAICDTHGLAFQTVYQMIINEAQKENS